MEMIPFIPFTEILKLVISGAKKVKDFKPLFKELASTIERLVPIFEEIDSLQKKHEPGNKDLIFLTKLMLRAKKMVDKCSKVRVYSLVKINSYTKKIKKINEDFFKFCQIDLPLIRHRDLLRSRSQTRPLQGQHQNQVHLSLARQESLEVEEELSSREAEELQLAIQESISLRRQQEEQVAKRIAYGSSSFGEEDEQRILWENYNDNGKRKLVQEDEQVAVALQESLSNFKDNEKRKQVQEDELVAVALQESIESFKNNKRRKQVQEDELVAIALEESLNTEEPISLQQREKQVANKRTRELEKDKLDDESVRTPNGSSASARAPWDEDDLQWVIWESLTKKQRKSI